MPLSSSWMTCGALLPTGSRVWGLMEGSFCRVRGDQYAGFHHIHVT